MVLVVMSGGCGGGSDSNHASSNVINAPGATLPADPDNWTTEEKAAWVNQGTLLLDRITSEEFEGRMTGAAGYEKAANFAAENFKAWGLEPLNGSYFQDFSISYSMPVKTSPVLIFMWTGRFGSRRPTEITSTTNLLKTSCQLMVQIPALPEVK